MKKRFYLFALLTTTLLSSAYATNWVDVPLTDINNFKMTCEYRFTIGDGAQMIYATQVAPGILKTTFIGQSLDELDIMYNNKANTTIGGYPTAINQMQMRCD